MSTLFQNVIHLGGACLAAGLLLSCSGAGESIATTYSDLAPAPIASATGESGKLKVAVYTVPSQPPPADDDGVVLVVTDATTGAPVEGLSVAVTPWMPAMGHGTCCVPVFTDQGKGHYVSTNVSLFMPGEWELQTHLSDADSGAVEDTVNPTFDVP